MIGLDDGFGTIGACGHDVRFCTCGQTAPVPTEAAPTQPDAVDARGQEINSLTLALEAHKTLLAESLLREGNLLNALHEIADLDKHGGYNTACHRARAAIAANKS